MHLFKVLKMINYLFQMKKYQKMVKNQDKKLMINVNLQIKLYKLLLINKI